MQPPLGGLGPTYDVHPLGSLESAYQTFLNFFRYVLQLWANIDWKSAFSLQRGQFAPKFEVEGVAFHQPFFLSEN